MSDSTRKTHDILVVDDDVEFTRYLTELLDAEYYRVEVAYDGASALKAYSKIQPSLIITDIIMPELDGLGFILKIRSENTHIPIIAVTGGNCDGVKYINAANQFGANRVLTKPFDSDIFLAVLDELLM